MNLEPGDVVLCTVDRIVGTTVFVNIDGNGEGSIVFSEIAPGRIRNIRDYVFPKKKIVCKVLRISADRVDLSLRRVTLKEQKELKERYKEERSLINILRTILKEKAENVLEDISKRGGIQDFLEKIKNNPRELEELMGKQDSKKVFEILKAQKQKRAVIKKEVVLKSMDSDGIKKIKEILGNIEGAEIRYISAGKYSLKREDENIKEADQKLNEIIEVIEKRAKMSNLDFSIVKK
jgi:translation initiation factor 2 alpha subunit (eIF-2alpha)